MISQRSDAFDGDTQEVEFPKKEAAERDVISVTTRHARCVMRIPGTEIIKARRRPILFCGEWVKVMD